MSSFQPTRASPPLRSIKPIHDFRGPPSIDFSVISSSTVVVPELLNLTADDIEFIEAVIKRAGPFATTFPLVFKAYNDVLKERDMDAGEVKYYGKLLKLGTMKGKNWGEKWEAVQKYHPQVILKSSKKKFSFSLLSKSTATRRFNAQPRKRVTTRQSTLKIYAGNTGTCLASFTGRRHGDFGLE